MVALGSILSKGAWIYAEKWSHAAGVGEIQQRSYCKPNGGSLLYPHDISGSKRDLGSMWAAKG